MRRKNELPVDWDKEREEFLTEHLRRASLLWSAKDEARRAARTQRLRNPDTGRLAWFGRCAACGTEMLESSLLYDHKEPVVPVDRDYSRAAYDAEGLGKLVVRMFPEPSGYQMLCPKDHAEKTRVENESRNRYRRLWVKDRPVDNGDMTSIEEME